MVELRVSATPRERAEHQENERFPPPAPHWITLRATGRFDISTNPPRLGRTAFCSDIGHTPISYSSSSQGVTGFRSQRTQVFGGDITEVLQLRLRPALLPFSGGAWGPPATAAHDETRSAQRANCATRSLLSLVFFRISPARLGSKLRFDTLRLWRSQLKMSHTSREKLIWSIGRKNCRATRECPSRLNEDEHCADVLQRSRCRTRRHQLHHGGTNRGPYPQPHAPGFESSEEAAEDVIEIVKSYLK